jgi:hypothetical protein
MVLREDCIADGCTRAAEKDRKYCHGHRKQEKLRKPISKLRDYGQPAAAYLKAKAEEWADARDDDERAAKLAWKRLSFAATRYAKARQKVPRRMQST